MAIWLNWTEQLAVSSSNTCGRCNSYPLDGLDLCHGTLMQNNCCMQLICSKEAMGLLCLFEYS